MSSWDIFCVLLATFGKRSSEISMPQGAIIFRASFGGALLLSIFGALSSLASTNRTCVAVGGSAVCAPACGVVRCFRVFGCDVLAVSLGVGLLTVSAPCVRSPSSVLISVLFCLLAWAHLF